MLNGFANNDALNGGDEADDLHPGSRHEHRLRRQRLRHAPLRRARHGRERVRRNGDGSTTGAVTDTFTGIENVWGSQAGDTITMAWIGVASEIRGRKGFDFLDTDDREALDRMHGGEDTDTCSNADGDVRAKCELP